MALTHLLDTSVLTACESRGSEAIEPLAQGASWRARGSAT